MDSEQQLDLESGLTVTHADVAALRQASDTVPSWFALSWQELLQLMPAAALKDRPTATDDWQPFSLA